MPQLNHWMMNMVAGVATVWGTTMGVPTASALAIPEPTFADLCRVFQGISGSWSNVLYERLYAWQTMEALMSGLTTDDCETAEQRLVAVDVLRGPQLQTAYLPGNGLMVDFPVGVDLQMIAIATPNLTELNLNGRVITDLAPIAELKQLQTLRLANTQLQDITVLTALPRLTILDISYNQIESIAPIAQISTIRSLNIAYNPFSDISPIGKILTPATEQEWQFLDLSGIEVDISTCPDNLEDICGEGFE